MYHISKLLFPKIITDARFVEINPCSFINLKLYAQTQVFSPVGKHALVRTVWFSWAQTLT